MLHRVIAGYDGHDGGRDAIALAQALEPGLLTVLLAYGPRTIISPVAAITYWDDLRDEARRRVAEACREPAIAADQRVAFDTSAARALRDAAVEQHADLVVVGSSHRGPIGRLLAGDVGSTLLQDCPCPVAIAPRGLRDAACKEAWGLRD